jgi:CheY-like chemotaxis protein
LRVLIVEDEAVLAMDLGAMIEDSGHQVVAEAGSLSEVKGLSPNIEPDLVFLDMQLAGGDSGLEVCPHVLTSWPNAFVVFVTANPRKLPDDFAGGHGVIPKPFSRSGLMGAMRYLTEAICAPPPVSPQPPSFTPSPRFDETWRTP